MNKNKQASTKIYNCTPTREKKQTYSVAQHIFIDMLAENFSDIIKERVGDLHLGIKRVSITIDWSNQFCFKSKGQYAIKRC